MFVLKGMLFAVCVAGGAVVALFVYVTCIAPIADKITSGLNWTTAEGRKRMNERKRPAVTHDLTERYWGHDYSFDPSDEGRRGRMVVFSPAEICLGDFVLIQNGWVSTRYEVLAVSRPSDPGDQYFLGVAFAPRSQEELKDDASRARLQDIKRRLSEHS